MIWSALPGGQSAALIPDLRNLHLSPARAAAGLISVVQQRRVAVPASVPTADCPILVIGGLPLGGAGRTPATIFLARLLRSRGRRVAILGHGYRAQRSPIRRAGDRRTDGDEAIELSRALPDVPVWLGRPRWQAAQQAARHADVILSDGGLGARDLRASTSIVLHDATQALSVFPVGRLRFPLTVWDAAPLRWLHRVDEPGALTMAADVESVWRPAAVLGPDGAPLPARALLGSWVAVSGIARPGSFEHALAQVGITPVEHRAFPDHHRFRRAELQTPPGCRLVTTAKDAARLPPGHDLHVLEGGLHVVRGEAALSAFLATWGL